MSRAELRGGKWLCLWSFERRAIRKLWPVMTRHWLTLSAAPARPELLLCTRSRSYVVDVYSRADCSERLSERDFQARWRAGWVPQETSKFDFTTRAGVLSELSETGWSRMKD